MPSFSAGISSLNAGYIATSQQDRTSTHLPNGEPRPGADNQPSEKALEVRKAKIAEVDRLIAEAKERRERKESSRERRKQGEKDGASAEVGPADGVRDDGEEKRGWLHGLREKIAGRGEASA